MSKKVLIVDIGNTAIEFAVFEGENLQEFLGFFKIPDDTENIKKVLNSYKNQGLKLDEGMIFSVVPKNNEMVQKVVEEVFKIKPEIFDWESYDLENRNPEIKEAIGADLLADIKEARKEKLYPCLVADFGTITKLLLVNEDGSFEGLSLIPGFETTVKSFSSSTALLPELNDLSFVKDKLGISSSTSMLHGAYWSSIYYVKEVFKSVNKGNTKLIITGGNHRFFKDEFSDAIIDPRFTLKGMNVLFQETLK